MSLRKSERVEKNLDHLQACDRVSLMPVHIRLTVSGAGSRKPSTAPRMISSLLRKGSSLAATRRVPRSRHKSTKSCTSLSALSVAGLIGFRSSSCSSALQEYEKYATASFRRSADDCDVEVLGGSGVLDRPRRRKERAILGHGWDLS